MSKRQQGRAAATPQRALQLEILDRVGDLAAAGVRVLEVGQGASRVRLELDPAAAHLLRRRHRGNVPTLAPDRAGGPERADDHDAADTLDPIAGDDDEQAGDDLDVAHLP